MDHVPHPTAVLIQRFLMLLGGLALVVALGALFLVVYLTVFQDSVDTMRLSFCLTVNLLVLGALVRANRLARAAGRTTMMVKVWLGVFCLLTLFTIFVPLDHGQVSGDPAAFVNATQNHIFVKVVRVTRKNVMGDLVSDDIWTRVLAPSERWDLRLPRPSPFANYAVLIGQTTQRADSEGPLRALRGPVEDARANPRNDFRAFYNAKEFPTTYRVRPAGKAGFEVLRGDAIGPMEPTPTPAPPAPDSPVRP